MTLMKSGKNVKNLKICAILLDLLDTAGLWNIGIYYFTIILWIDLHVLRV